MKTRVKIGHLKKNKSNLVNQYIVLIAMAPSILPKSAGGGRGAIAPSAQPPPLLPLTLLDKQGHNPIIKDREGLRLFAESLVLMTCFDLTIFFYFDRDCHIKRVF